LQAAEFLYPVRRFGEPEHRFRHALTHQVAYASMLKNRRRELHRRIVEAVEQTRPTDGAEPLELLAHHAFCGELWEKAVGYCRKAGRAAAARPAHREAVMRFEQALEALEHLSEEPQRTELAIDIRFDLRNSLHPMGQLERILEHIRIVESLASTLGDQRRLGQASSFLCQYHRLMGDLGLAIEAGERAVAISDRLGDLPLWIVASTHLGAALTARGEYRRAAEILTRSVGRFREDLIGDAMGTTGIQSVFSRTYLVSALVELGEFDTARPQAQEAMKTAANRNHIYSQIFACYGLGSVSVLKGELPAGIAALERGIDLCRSWSLPLGFPLLATVLGQAYCLDSRPDQAAALLEEAERQADAMTRRGGHAMLLVRLGEAYQQMHRAADARRCAESALSLARSNTELGLEAYALRLLAELENRRGEGEALYRRALQQAERLEMLPLAALCHLGLGNLYGAARQLDSADEHLRAAAALFRALGMTQWLSKAEAQAGA
jgi:tetratricopeptide (TPR) repeat protein